MNPYALAIAAALTVAARHLAPRVRRRRLERAKALYEAYIRDAGAHREGMREVLEMEGAVVARTIRSAPVDPSRLSFHDGTDRHPYLAEGEVGVLENFLAPRDLIRREYLAALDIAHLHYRNLERDSLKPTTWLKWLLFLPRDLLDYLGLHTHRTRGLVTALQLLYWLGALAIPGVWAWERFGLSRYVP